MPIHLVSTGLSKVVALETYPVVLAAVFAIVFLKQWSAGLDLLGRLDRKVSEAQEAPIGNDEKGNVLVKRRRLKSRDLHGSVFLIVVSRHITIEKLFGKLTEPKNLSRAGSPLKGYWSALNYPL